MPIVRNAPRDEVASDVGPFAVVPVALLGDTDVSDRAVRVWCAVASYADRETGEAFPFQETLAERLGVSVDTVQRGIRVLVQTGWLSVRPRMVEGRKCGNVYTVHWLNGNRKTAVPPGSRRSAVSGNRKCDGAETADSHGAETATGAASIRTDHVTDHEPTTNDGAALVLSMPAAPATVGNDQRVFNAWIEATERTERTVLSPKRRRLIRQALAQYPLDDVLDAVRGWKFSGFHCGDNRERKVYNEIELLLRDAEHIEQFRDYARGARERNGGELPVPETWKTLKAMGIMQ